jgi:hypothetical protein
MSETNVDCLAPDVVYEVGQEMPAIGHDSVQEMWERWDTAWDEMETGERLFDVYTLRDGMCVRKLEFRRRSEALEAAGIEE